MPFIYLTTDDGIPSLPRVLKDYESSDHDFVVPCGHVPFMGYFDESGRFYVDYVETPFCRDELLYRLENEEFVEEQFEPSSWEKCIVMISIKKLQENEIEVPTGEGCKWDSKSGECDHSKSSSEEGLRWNPYSKKYDKMCQCGSGRLDFLIGKSFYEKFRISDEVFCDCQTCPFCNKYHDWPCAEEEDEEKRRRK